MKAIILIMVLIVSMGPAGISGMSQITGLHILSGYYDLQEDHAVVCAEGVDKAGVYWSVVCQWIGGMPQLLTLYNPRYGL